jgi:hypothetical protein
MKALKERWADLWARMGCKTQAEHQLEGLLGRYAEPWRAHHTIAHIESSLDELDAARSACCDPDAIEAAIWYHDAVYDPKAHDNEIQSARLFRMDAVKILNFRNLAFINRRRGVVAGIEAKSGQTVLNAQVPLVEMFGYATAIRSLSKGRASYSMEPWTFEQVPSSILASILEKANKRPAARS